MEELVPTSAPLEKPEWFFAGFLQIISPVADGFGFKAGPQQHNAAPVLPPPSPLMAPGTAEHGGDSGVGPHPV